ncbi:MAG: Two-component sensor histidine kinase [Schumannella sp.]|nr:Two-component sensor histidine kinase [Schumannella sp.]
MIRGLSIRTRITLGSVLVAAVLLAGALVLARAEVTAVLADSDVALAAGDLAGFESDITAQPGTEVDDPGTGVLVYVRDPGGAVQVDTLPRDVRRMIDHHPAVDDEFRMTDDESRGFVVVGRTVETTQGVWMLWAARSTSASELAIGGLDRVFVIIGVVLLAGFGLASWLLTTLALRPVSRMRRRAESLGTAMDGDLPVGQADDELSALATTLNALLGRVRSTALREKQMVSDAAHELRTPLASLRTQLELARDDAGDAGALARHLISAESSVERLASLAGHLLELSRLEAAEGTAPLSCETAELVGELMRAVDRARMVGLATSTEVGFELSRTDDARRYRVDPQGFGRIADNLLTNALAASAGGSVEARLAQTATGIELTVADDGPGMPEDFIPRAFERFSRADVARGSQSGGSGLGLALVHALATAAGGTVQLRNTAPGFEAVVTLPNM